MSLSLAVWLLLSVPWDPTESYLNMALLPVPEEGSGLSCGCWLLGPPGVCGVLGLAEVVGVTDPSAVVRKGTKECQGYTVIVEFPLVVLEATDVCNLGGS